jgi:hypothetical protein
LGPQPELGAPAVVEEDEHRPDVVLVSDRKKMFETLQETARVLVPEKIMQEDPDRVEAQPFGPAEFLVDSLRVEGLRLPHLQRVDGRPGDVVAAERPRLRVGPGPGPGLGPTA